MNLKAFAVISFAVTNGMFLGCKSAKPVPPSNQQSLGVVSSPGSSKTEPEWIAKPAPYHASETRLTELVHTRLRVSFDWQKQQLIGDASLICKPYFYPQNTLILDAKGFDIKSVKLSSGKELAYTYNKKKLHITLDKTYNRTEKYEVVINYVAKPNELEAGGSEAIMSDKGLYFINPLGEDKTKPRQIWTQGETQASSCWFPTIDSPNQKMTQEIYITVEKNFTTLSNGNLVYSKNNANGTRTDYWKQELPHSPYLVMMAIGEFAVVHDSWKNKDVDYYVEPKFKSTAKAVFGNTPEMLGFFSQKLGVEYPWDKYAQVVVRDYVSGAMENTSATLHNEGLQLTRRELLDKNWDDYIAHELFHQWFGDLVTAESWSNLPLNESFATYGEYLWAEHKYGLEEADLIGQKDLGNYLRESNRKRVPLIRYNYVSQEDMFDSHSYAKGGRVLHMLRNYLGDDAFFASLKKYLTENKFKNAELANLRLAFEAVTGEDLQWFFDQWFMKPGHPELKVEQKYENGKVSLRVLQQQDTTYSPLYKLPIKVAVWTNGKKTEYPIVVSRFSNEYEFPVTAKPNLVLFDSDAQLLGKVQFEKNEDELIYQYYHAERYLQKYQALSSLIGRVSEPKVMALFLDALNDKFWRLRSVAVSAFNITRYTTDEAVKKKFNEPQFEPAKQKIRQIALSDPKTSVRADAINALSSYRSAAFSDVFGKVIQDSSYTVASAGLDALVSVGDVSEFLPKLKSLQASDNEEIVSALGSFYARHGNASQFPWFQKQLKQLPVLSLGEFLPVYGTYLLQLPPTEKNNGIQSLENLALKHENYRVRLGAFQALIILSDDPSVKEVLKRIKENEKDERLTTLYQNM